MFDPYPLIKHTLKRIRQKIPSLDTTEQKLISFIKIIIIGISILLIYFCIQSIFKPYDGYDVQPFETIGLGENSDGKALATLLKFYLQDIKDIYEIGLDKIAIPKNGTKSQMISRPLNLSIPRPLKEEQLDYSISQIGTIGAEGVSLSIGNVFLLIKEALRNRPNTITCSLQRYNSTTILVAILKDNQNNRTMTFKDESTRFTDDQIPSMINNLSFKMALALCKQSGKPDIYPKNWQTFKFVTQGRDFYNRYMDTRDIKDLNNSYNKSQLAENFEPGYSGTFELLSDLGICYLNKNYHVAEKIFLNISKHKPFESALGLGFVYDKYNDNNHRNQSLSAFEKASQLNPNNSMLWNKLGTVLIEIGNYTDAITAFDKAAKLDDEFADAFYNKGLALAALGKNNSSKYNEAITAYDKAIGIDSSNADFFWAKGDALAALSKNNRCMYTEAIKAYNRTLELDPSNADAKAKLSKVRELSNQNYSSNQ
jgi:tetratricopeptide (TPR) repeat protein